MNESKSQILCSSEKKERAQMPTDDPGYESTLGSRQSSFKSDSGYSTAHDLRPGRSKSMLPHTHVAAEYDTSSESGYTTEARSRSSSITSETGPSLSQLYEQAILKVRC